MDELDLLFKEESIKLEKVDENNIAAKIEERVLHEFTKTTDEEISRREEIEDLTKAYKTLDSKYRSCRNIRNPRKTEQNKKISTLRKNIKRRMEDIKLRLQDISDERKGANLSNEEIMKETKEAEPVKKNVWDWA